MKDRNPILEPVLIEDADGNVLDLRITMGAVKRWAQATKATLEAGALQGATLDDVFLFVALCAKKKHPDLTPEQVEDAIELGPLLLTLYERWDRIFALWPKLQEALEKFGLARKKIEATVRGQQQSETESEAVEDESPLSLAIPSNGSGASPAGASESSPTTSGTP